MLHASTSAGVLGDHRVSDAWMNQTICMSSTGMIWKVLLCVCQATAGVTDDEEVATTNGTLASNTIGAAGNPTLVPHNNLQRNSMRAEPSLVRYTRGAVIYRSLCKHTCLDSRGKKGAGKCSL